jgi:hypothetical protein
MTKFSSFYFTLLISGSSIVGCTKVWAQADFREGYIVRPAGDTVRGQINYQRAQQGAQQCSFRIATGSEVTTYTPAELRGYGLASGERYISQATPTEMSPTSALTGPASQPAANTVVSPQPMFLEVLVSGPASLLRAKSSTLHYYVLKQGAAFPLELVQAHQQVVVDGTVRGEQVMPVYRGTLAEQFADCPAVLLSVSRTGYKESALIAIVEQYNVCRQPNYRVATQQKQATEVGLEGLIGGQISRTYYRDHDTRATLPGALSPEIGLALHVSGRAATQKLSFRLELHYVQQVASGSFQKETDLLGLGRKAVTTYETRFKAAYLRLPFLIRYMVPGTKLRPFIEAGLSFNYATKLDPQIRQTSSTATGGTTSWHQLFDDISYMNKPFHNYEFGYITGIGVRFAGVTNHPVAIVARVERSEGFMEYIDWGTPIVRGSLLLSYDLAKPKSK